MRGVAIGAHGGDDQSALQKSLAVDAHHVVLHDAVLLAQVALSRLLAVPVAAGETIYAGSLVCANSSGYAVPGADSAGLTFVGVATEKIDNSDGANGGLSVVVRRRGRYRFGCQTNLNQSALSAAVYAVDDQTVSADAAETTNDVRVGTIDKIESGGDCWVSIDSTVIAGVSWTEPTTTAAPTTTTTTAA